MNKVMYYILDFIFLIFSYMLCDFLTEKFCLLIGVVIALPTYIIIVSIINKILKIK